MMSTVAKCSFLIYLLDILYSGKASFLVFPLLTNKDRNFSFLKNNLAYINFSSTSQYARPLKTDQIKGVRKAKGQGTELLTDPSAQI